MSKIKKVYPDRRIVLMVRQIPYDLKEKFRLCCVNRDTTMQVVIEKLMEAYVKSCESE